MQTSATPSEVNAEVNAEVNLAQLFRNRSATYSARPRWRQKRDGKWISATGRENQALVNSLIAGLDALGARPGDVIGILSETRWEWMAADWAILGLGAVTVTIYPSNVPDTLAFILNDSDARYLFVQNRKQYEKLLGIRDQIPGVRRLILFDDAESVAADPWTISFEALRALSQRSPEEADRLAAERATAIRPDDRMTIVYTSGTTGRPKGVVLTHASYKAQVVAACERLNTIRPGQVDLLFLPLSHVFGRIEHISGVNLGMSTVIAGSLDTLIEDIKEAKPDLFFSVPRIYEKAYATIHARIDAGSPIQKHIFTWAEGVGSKVSHLRERRQRVPLGLGLRYRLAERFVFHRVREAFGGNVDFAVTSAAPLDLKILEFFNASGVLLLEAWGLTEVGGAFTINAVSDYRFGSVGKVLAGHELRLDDDGEILVRGPCVFPGYHNNPAATAEVFTPDGWFKTGDIGTIDADGFVRIVDRKKDLIITASGKNIAPQNIENTLKKAPFVSQVAVYGDRHPYLVALVTLDAAQVAAWAASHGVNFTDVSEVYTDPRFRSLFDAGFQAANNTLASYETVKYYEILPEDFTMENELLTPTLKIRRRAIVARYGELFESLYRPVKAEVAR